MNNEQTSYALINRKTGRIVVDFGNSNRSLDEYIERYTSQHGSPPNALPAKITTVTKIEFLNK